MTLTINPEWLSWVARVDGVEHDRIPITSCNLSGYYDGEQFRFYGSAGVGGTEAGEDE